MRFHIPAAVAAGSLLMFAAVPASAGEAQKGQPVAAAAASVAAGPSKMVKEKKICKSLQVTGTRMAKRACHTTAEWKRIETLD